MNRQDAKNAKFATKGKKTVCRALRAKEEQENSGGVLGEPGVLAVHSAALIGDGEKKRAPVAWRPSRNSHESVDY